jgi:hypothetical protein
MPEPEKMGTQADQNCGVESNSAGKSPTGIKHFVKSRTAMTISSK